MEIEEVAVEADDEIDRRGFLKCMAWAGSGVLLTVNGGVLRSFNLSALRDARAATLARSAVETASFSFVQISDSHIGFSKAANPNVVGTLQAAVAKINGSVIRPDLLLHTGDLSHLSKDDEWDAMDQVLKEVRTGERFFVPGEHDVLVENGKNYRARYGKETVGDGWYSFDHKGVHFVGLVNVLNLKAGGLGDLGEEQLAWLKKDLAPLASSTPIVVFAHVPLWEVYPEWGWGTDDGARALSLMKRFGSVSVLNGHIHQTVQKVEGNVFFHTATSTAFPQPKPGTAAGPGPMTVPAGELGALLGVTSVHYVPHRSHLAVTDSALDGSPGAAGSMVDAKIANFAFSPTKIYVKAGDTVRWTNEDDMIHTVADMDGSFKSQPLDTGQTFSFTFKKPGTVRYYCSIHPKMVGVVVVG